MIALKGKARIKRLLAGAIRPRARPLFVLSTGRVGTVTLTYLLNLSDEIHAEHEPGPQFLEETRWAYERRPLSKEARSALLADYAGSRVRFLLRAWRTGSIYAECSNRLTFLADVLADGFPRSRFIYLYRDPASVVRSGMRRGWYRDNPWDPFRIRPRQDDRWAREWEGWTAFEKCCWFWHATNEFCLQIADRLPESRILRLSTRELFASDGSGAERTFEWLNVGPVSRSEILRVVGTRYNAGSEGEFPPWPEWSDAQKEALVRIAGGTAERLGYLSFVPTA